MNALVKRLAAALTIAAFPLMGAMAQSDLSGMAIPVFTPPPTMVNNGLQGAYEEKVAPASLARVVVYRAPASSVKAQEGAPVYLDGELQTALRPGGYTEFCVSPDRHLVYGTQGEKTYRDSASLKTAKLYEAGQTYYYESNVAQDGAKIKMVEPSQAAQVLPQTQKQVHLHSRAANALPCQ